MPQSSLISILHSLNQVYHLLNNTFLNSNCLINEIEFEAFSIITGCPPESTSSTSRIQILKLETIFISFLHPPVLITQIETRTFTERSLLLRKQLGKESLSLPCYKHCEDIGLLQFKLFDQSFRNGRSSIVCLCTAGWISVFDIRLIHQGKVFYNGLNSLKFF